MADEGFKYYDYYPPVRGDMLGIFVWLAISVVLATRLFKWEVV